MEVRTRVLFVEANGTMARQFFVPPVEIGVLPKKKEKFRVGTMWGAAIAWR
jgi:hypothetical protein